MRFDVLTLFPDVFSTVTKYGVTGRAHAKNLWELYTWNPRSYATDIHNTVDDRPYGGGPGMVMMAQPLHDALTDAQVSRADNAAVILLSPAGQKFDQSIAQNIANANGAILVCGRYEGIDQRFIDKHITHEVSIGDFVLSGGEIAALAVIDSAVRLLDGALGHNQSAVQDSFSSGVSGLLDSPHYTRPELWQGDSVPATLISGNHANIDKWRREQSLRITALRRPDLIEKADKHGDLSASDKSFLKTDFNN